MSSMADGSPSSATPNDRINDFARLTALAAEKTTGGGGGNGPPGVGGGGPPQSAPPGGNDINDQSRKLALQEVRGAPVLTFISYAHKDNKRMDKFLNDLRQVSDCVKPFSDRDLKPGELWEEVLQVQIKKAGIVVLLITPDYVGSQFIGETELPAIKKRIEATCHVCGDFMAGFVPINARISLVQYKDAFKWLLKHEIKPKYPDHPIWNGKTNSRELIRILSEIAEMALKRNREACHAAQ